MKNLKFLVTVIMFTFFTSFASSDSHFNENTQMAFEDGKASDCARMARSAVLMFADAANDDPNGENFEGWLALYNHLYLACYNS